MKDTALSLEIVNSVRKRYKSGMMRWHYEHGLMLYASLKVASKYGDETIFPWVYSLYSPLINEDGSISTYRLGEFNLDQINAGRSLFELFDRTKEIRFMKAVFNLVSQLDKQPRCLNGVYWHKQIYPWQIWLDGLYMQGPFQAEYSKRFSDMERLDDVIKQLNTTYSVLNDRNTGLVYHAWDETKGQRWSDPKTGLSPHFWSRSIGWYMMALTDVISFLDIDDPRRDELVKKLNALLDSLLKYQDEKGLWWQVTDQKDREGNYLETSSTSMFSYVIYRGIRMGYLDDSYMAYADKAIEGIKKLYLFKDDRGEYHLDGICSVAGLGGNPYRDGSFKYYICEPRNLDDFKGVGPFVLALLEKECCK